MKRVPRLGTHASTGSFLCLLSLVGALSGISASAQPTRVKNTGLAVDNQHGGFPGGVGEEIVAVAVSEAGQAQDLNGDGDLGDEIVHLVETQTGATSNLELAIGNEGFDPEGLLHQVTVVGDYVLFAVVESYQGDRNGDGDVADVVPHLYDVQTGVTRSLPNAAAILSVGDRFVTYGVRELSANRDLNGDGDLGDHVLHLIDRRTASDSNLGMSHLGGTLIRNEQIYFQTPEPDLGADLNGDGDLEDTVLQMYDGQVGSVRNLALSVQVSSLFYSIGIAEAPILLFWEGGLVCPVREAAEGVDLNGDGDLNDLVVHLVTCCACPRAGSVNASSGSEEDVLLLNRSAGEGRNREVTYQVLGPLRLEMRAPSTLGVGEVAPFALYAWTTPPVFGSSYELPFGLGTTCLPTPLTGGSPEPVLIWNNAGRQRYLGCPTRPSRPAPSVIVDRMSAGVATRFFVQGLIYDPGSAAPIPASVTNGIVAIPEF